MNRQVVFFGLVLLAIDVRGSVIDVHNANTNDDVVVIDTCQLAGTGGVRMTRFEIGSTGRFVLDPVKTPVLITGGVPKFEQGAKIALDASYATRTLGRVALLTWKGQELADIPEGLFDGLSVGVGAAPTLTQETYRMNSQYWSQLVLDINPAKPKPRIRVHPIGDSITEGAGSVGFGAPNYRIALMQKLASRGYDVVSTGFRVANNGDSAGIPAPESWRWHSGISGSRIVTKTGMNSRVGFRESIETVLEAAGAPESGREDVIIFFLGANDTGSDLDHTYESWTNAMSRIIRVRPTSRILVGSTLYFQDIEWRKEFNERMRRAIEDERLFPENQVFYVRHEPGFPKDDEYLISPGNQHPSWMGHEITSTHWADAVEYAVAQPAIKSFDGNNPASCVPHLTTGVVANVKPEYRDGFERIYAIDMLDIATNGARKLTRNGSMRYAYENPDIKPGATYVKVAYYMELRHSRTGNVRWLWADMDAWGDKTAASFSFPLNRTEQHLVSALHVDTNDGGVFCVLPDDDSVSGWIQFANVGFDVSGGSGVFGAPAKALKYDWDMRLDPGSDWGLFQIFRVDPNGGPRPHMPAQTLMSYTGWEVDSPHEVGIGDFAATPQHDGISYLSYARDMARVSTAAYTLARLEVWAVPSPVGYEVDAKRGYDFTNAFLKVTVDSLKREQDVRRLVLSVSDERSGALIGKTSVAVTKEGVYDVCFPEGVIAGRDYRYEVSFEDAAGEKLLDVGTSEGVVSLNNGAELWFSVSPGSLVCGRWDVEPFASGNAYVLDGSERPLASFVPGETDMPGGLAAVSYDVTFEDGLRQEDLQEVDGGHIAGALALGFAEDAAKNEFVWKALSNGEWIDLEGVEARPSTWSVRIEYDSTGARRVRYSVRESGTTDYVVLRSGGESWLPVALTASRPRLVEVVGAGSFRSLRGDVQDVDVARYDGVGYRTLSEALAAAGVQSERPIVLLTNATIAHSNFGMGAYTVGFNDFDVCSAGSGLRVSIDRKAGLLTLARSSGLTLIFW